MTHPLSPLPPQDDPGAGRAFAGEVVVFTGKLSLLGRRDAQALVERLGGATGDEVTSKTTLLVVGGEGFARGAAPADRGGASAPAPPDTGGDDPEKSRKLRKAAEVNARRPGRIRVLPEAEFCRLAGLPTEDRLAQQFYGVRDIRGMYPAIREDHLRCLEQWGFIRPVLRTNAQRYYPFADLLVVRQLGAELAAGVPFRRVLRGLAAQRAGQLSLDFHGRSDAQPARVVALERRPAAGRAGAAGVTRARPLLEDPQSALAARYFLEAAGLDEDGGDRQEEAAAAYRKALVVDPDLVPALVNLANIHYARDEVVEAQALYERAIGLEPDCFEAHFNVANIHHDLGRYDLAEASYREAIALNPAYPEAHFYLAVTLEKTGRSREAKPHWRQYQQLAPDGEWVALAREFSE